MEKVYKTAAGDFKEFPITQKVLEIYEIRQMREWEVHKAVYDAWVLSNNQRREWFPYKFFIKIYPDQKEKKNQLFEDKNRVKFSLEDQLSLHLTVNIDGKKKMQAFQFKI